MAAAALVIELAVTGLTRISPADDGLYGAPIPVGFASASSFIFPGSTSVSTFQPVNLVINVVLTAALVMAALRFLKLQWSGMVLAGSVVGILVVLVTGVIHEMTAWPFAGLPVPIQGRFGPPNALALWADLAFWTVALPFWMQRRARRAPVGARLNSASS